MLNLIRKDFLVSGIYLLGLIGLWGFQALTVYRFNLMALVSAGFTMVLPFTFFAMDDKYDADTHHCSLPVTRASIVYARYLSAFLLVLAGAGLTLLFGSIYQALFSIGGRDLDLLMTAKGTTTFVLSILLCLALCFPFVFRGGLRKGLFHFAVALVVVVLAMTGIESRIAASQGYDMFSRTPFAGLVDVVGGWFHQMHVIQTRAIGIALMIVVLLVSISLSARFYIRREL